MKFDCGWAGKILWVDLSSGRHFVEDTESYLPTYLGGRGLAAKIAWDHLKSKSNEYAEDSLLMFMTGPLGGTLAPAAGRGYVFGIAPQGYPPHYTRSGFGGRWSSKLKLAGFDGLIIQGRADSPSLLLIDNETVEIKAGRKYWGQDTIETQKILQGEFGLEAGLIVIGPAGENLVRIATINSGANNVAGQGGFGAVMGSKNLKAIVIRGTGGIKIANVERLLSLREECVRLLGDRQERPQEVKKVSTHSSTEWKTEDLIEKGELGAVTMGYSPCTACPFRCRASGMNNLRLFKDVPGVSHPARLSGVVKCSEFNAMSWGTITKREKHRIKEKLGRDYRFDIGFRAGFETVNLADRYGINIWEFNALQVWLTECKMAGIDLEPVLGMPFDENGALFWQTLLRMIAYKEGIGSVFSEGTARAAENLGKDMKPHSLHAAYGFAHHGLGIHNYGFFRFPFWVTVALMWSTDTRDPLSDTGHKYCFDLAMSPDMKQAEKVAASFYGANNTLSPHPSQIPDGELPAELLDLAYSDKEKVTIRHQNRSMVNGSLILCDGAFPIVLSPVTEGGFGDSAMEAKLLQAVTGFEIDEAGLDGMGERLFNLERAISIREGRTKKDDLELVPGLETRGDWTRGIKLDGKRYRELLKRYYKERGWDPETGAPLKRKLVELGLTEVAEVLYQEA
jgi:aldehyde:ferredoxin oxidoreductase